MTWLPNIMHEVEESLDNPAQRDWFAALSKKYRMGQELFERQDRGFAIACFNLLNRTATEMFKATLLFSRPVRLFQGTSVTSIVRPIQTKQPLAFSNLDELAEHIATSYLGQQDEIHHSVKSATEIDTDNWYHRGYFFAVVVSSKLISQVLGLVVDATNVLIEVDGTMVDPHNLFDHPKRIREKYLRVVKKRIPLFANENWSAQEILSSLTLADATMPKLPSMTDKVILAPVHSNEIASFLSNRVTHRIKGLSGNQIEPSSISIIIYDTDSPVSHCVANDDSIETGAPALPGLTLLGISGSIDALSWLYCYRMALISQFHMPGVFCSNVVEEYVPYVLFGVIHPRNYYLLVNPDDLDLVRYRGNVSPRIEFFYLLPNIVGEEKHRRHVATDDEHRFSFRCKG